MKKNFYNQRTPQLLSWGTVKRSAAAIWIAAVILLAPAAVHAVDIDLASPGAGTVTSAGTNVYTVGTNTIELIAADSTYVLRGNTNAYGITVSANNVTIVLNGAQIYAPAAVDAIWFKENATLKIKSGANRLGNVDGSSYNGIWVFGGKNLTIEEDAAAATNASLTVYAGVEAAIVARSGASINIASGNIVITNANTTGKQDVHLEANANFSISGGDIQYYAAGQSVFDLAAGATVSISGGTIYRRGANAAQIFNVADETSKVKITGGSLDPYGRPQFNNVLGGIATNGTDTVRLVTVTGLPAAITNIQNAYGKNGLDGIDPIYIWLPKSDETLEVKGTDGVIYKGTITGTWDTNRAVALIPQGTPGNTGNPGLNPAGDPPGWIGTAGSPLLRFSGETYELTVTFAPDANEDRKVAITVDGEVKDYITVPDTIILRKGQTSLQVPYTVKVLPADKEGNLQGNILAAINGAGIPEQLNWYLFLNPLNDKPDRPVINVTFDYNPRTTLWTGEVKVNVVNGDLHVFSYSVDGGKTWKPVNKKSTIDPISIPAGAEWLYIKEPGSSFYIAYALDTNGNINAPVGLRRQVLIPSVANIETLPSAGRHYGVSRQDYSFTVVLKSPLPAKKELDVRTDRDNLTKEQDRVIEINADGSYTVTIKNLQQDVNISILIADGTAAIDGSNVWGANGQLYITSAKAANASIYALTGSLVKSVALTAGETAATSLPAGIYVVTLGGNTYKAVVK